MKVEELWGVMVVVAVVAAAAAAGILEVRPVSAGPSAAECKEERRLGINACKPVVYGKNPSPACCQRVRVTHLECVCPLVTPNLAALVDVNRDVRLIEGCGRKVHRHYKCGSIYHSLRYDQQRLLPRSEDKREIVACYKES